MRSVAEKKESVLDLLINQRRESGEPGIGTREVEAADLSDPIDRKALRDLCAEGKIVRSSGWTWIDEEFYQQEVAGGDQ